MSKVGTVNLYGCGGGGINIVKQLQTDETVEGMAITQTIFFDTSDSNLNGVVNLANVHLVPDLDGGGKVRRDNSKEIEAEVPNLLKLHPPKDLNVVVFTASGGTGSVAGPLLIKELMARDENVIAVMIGVYECAQTALNLSNTFKTLDNFTKPEQQNKPLILHYTKMNPTDKRSDIDNNVKFFISSLAFLASRQNDELDTTDIKHWLWFTKTTNLKPQLALVELHTNKQSVEENTPFAFSLASLKESTDEPSPNILPQYSCTGFYRTSSPLKQSFFFTLDNSKLKDILKELQTLMGTVNETKSTQKSGPSFIEKEDSSEDNGLIL